MLDDAKLFILPAIPYFWFSPPAIRKPDDTCSPCLCWKLFAVSAAPFKSEAETLDGSSRRLLAVCSTACLSAHVVPVAGAAALDDDVDILENLLCNSLSCRFRLDAAGGGAFDTEFWRGGTGGGLLPIPKLGTETPACPSRFSAPWFSTPCAVASCRLVSVYGGGGDGVYSSGFEFCRGGSRGGRLGAGFAPTLVGAEAGFGCRAGGLGTRAAPADPAESAL